LVTPSPQLSAISSSPLACLDDSKDEVPSVLGGLAMRKLWLLLVLTAPAWLVLSGVLPQSAPAQETAGGVIFSRYRQFKIPFNTGPGSARLKQLQLYLSTDQGRTWQQSTSAPPEQGHFRFSAERDDEFWFTVQTQDTDGKLYPPSLDGAAPSLKVVIDTQPPAVTLQ